VTYDASKPSTVARRPISPDKARELLGFTAKVELSEGIRRTLEWTRANPWAFPA
jgi:nucleoside-diphosphate-sugar epimerase